MIHKLSQKYYWRAIAALALALIVSTLLTSKTPRTIPARIARSAEQSDVQRALEWYAKFTPVTLAWSAAAELTETQLQTMGVLNPFPSTPSLRACLKIKPEFRKFISWDRDQTYRALAEEIRAVQVLRIQESSRALDNTTLQVLDVEFGIEFERSAGPSPLRDTLTPAASGTFSVRFLKGEYGYYLPLRKEPFFPLSGCERLTFDRNSDEE